MSRKLYAALLPLFAVAAFAVLPAVAQAQPHWYSNGTRIAGGTKVKVTTSSRTGKLKLEDKEIIAPAVAEVESTITDDGFVENPAPGGAGGPAGIDAVESFTETNTTSNICAAGEVTTTEATKLPWPTVLLAGPPIRVEIKGVEIDILCNGVLVARYEGTLTPRFVNSATPNTCSGATDSYLEFGEGSGFLTNVTTLTKGTVTGKDYIEGPAGDHCITVKNP